MEKNNLTVLKGGNSPDEFKDAIKALRDGMELHVEYVVLQSKLHKVKYDALIKEGFDAAQALELCRFLTV